MRLLNWTSRKSNHLMAAMTLVFWWGSYSLPHFKTEAPPTSGDSQIAGGAAIVSTGGCRQLANNARRVVPVKPADKSPRPTKSQVCGALNVFFLSLSRKPRPVDVPDPMTFIAWLYQVKDSDRFLPPPVDQRLPTHHFDAYIRHCAFLI
jgi:hypothetical protein